MKQSLYLLYCYLYIDSSTTIKIPLNRRKRDDAITEKSPMQLAIESELARKREEDADYEDVTNVSSTRMGYDPECTNAFHMLVLISTLPIATTTSLFPITCT